MNAHAIAALHTRQPDDWPTTDEWIEHCAAVHLAHSALDAAVRDEIERD